MARFPLAVSLLFLAPLLALSSCSSESGAEAQAEADTQAAADHSAAGADTPSSSEPDGAAAPGATDTTKTGDSAAGPSDLGAGDPGTQTGPDTTGAPDTSPPVASSLDNFIDKVAGAVCDALLRCCNEDDIDTYFLPYMQVERMEPLGPTLPPAAELSPVDCPAKLKPAFELGPFGPWVRAAQDGLATFSVEAFDACLGAMASAECGEGMRDALFDSTCFGLAAPYAGQQRSFFERSQPPGGPCTILTDGAGGAFFGTCDPTVAFCCYARDDGEEGCKLPTEGASGVCTLASQLGEPCTLFPDPKICATGLSCGAEEKCISDSYEDLPDMAAGDTCGGASFTLVGSCKDSWCDLGGSDLCEPLKELGAGCVFAYECASEYCEAGACAELTMCSGNGQGPGEPGPQSELEAAADRLATWLTGRFDSADQAAQNSSYYKIQLQACEVDAPSMGTRVLYVEQASMGDLGNPYRQRLYVIEPVEGEGVKVRSSIFAFDDPEAVVGLCRGAVTWSESAFPVTERAGCAVTLTWNDQDFQGGTQGKQCASTLGGAAYATSEVTVEADRLLSWDRGFNDSDVQVWGATEGPYEFIRRDGDPTVHPQPDAGSSGDDTGATQPPITEDVAGGETCSDAPPLAEVSTARDPSTASPYSHYVSSRFGALDDLNPIDTSGKEPGCSLVYDAFGKEVVFKVALAPGQTLRTKLTMAPASRPGGLYMLDGCDPVTWLDKDASGMCGNEEYRSDGHCGSYGFSSCDPLEWDYFYPEIVNGAPTESRTFFLVVDEVAGDVAESFHLEWAIF